MEVNLNRIKETIIVCNKEGIEIVIEEDKEKEEL